MKQNTRRLKFQLNEDDDQLIEHQLLPQLLELILSKRIKKIALDIETTPKYPFTEALDPWKGDIRLIGIYCDAGYFFHDTWTNQALAKIFVQTLEQFKIIVIVHNAWFEGTWFRWHYGVEEINWRCTLIQQRVATAGQRLPADLHSVCEYHGIKVEGTYEEKKALQLASYGGKISVRQINYVLTDAKKAWDCHERGMLTFPWPIQGYYDECKNLLFFIEMGVTGLPVNETLANEILIKIEEQLIVIERKLGFNPGSRLALEKLFQQCGLQPKEYTRLAFEFSTTELTDLSSLDDIDKHFIGGDSEEKQYEVEDFKQNFDDTVLLICEAKFPDKYKWREIRRYRRLQWSKGYLLSILKRVYKGRVRSRILPVALSGYRVSVSNPNLANSMRDSDLLKEIGIFANRIIFQEKGMMSTDGPAMHLRVLLQLCKDPLFKKAIESGDPHSQNAASIAAMIGKPWDFPFIAKTRLDKTHQLFSEVNKLRDGAKEFIYLWLNGGQANKAVVTLATGKAAYRGTVEEMERWISAIDNMYVCATALKSLLSDGPLRKQNYRENILKKKYGIRAHEYLRNLSLVVDDNHVLNSIGKYTHLSKLPFNARIIAPWMSGERVAVTTGARRVFEVRKEIGYWFSGWQHDEFIGGSSDPIKASNVIESIMLDTFRELLGFTKYYKDGDNDSPNRDKKGNPLGDFSATKMRISNLTEK